MPISLLLVVVTHLKIFQLDLKCLDAKAIAEAAKENLPVQQAKTILIKQHIRKHQEIIR